MALLYVSEKLVVLLTKVGVYSCNFLSCAISAISYVSLKLFGNSEGTSYTMFYARYQVSLYSRRMETFLKCQKFAKYHVRGCLRIFLLHATVSIMIRALFLFKRESSIWEKTTSKSRHLFNDFYWPKSNIRNIVYCKLLTKLVRHLV